jgi:hypothetical protein
VFRTSASRNKVAAAVASIKIAYAIPVSPYHYQLLAPICSGTMTTDITTDLAHLAQGIAILAANRISGLDAAEGVV